MRTLAPLDFLRFLEEEEILLAGAGWEDCFVFLEDAVGSSLVGAFLFDDDDGVGQEEEEELRGGAATRLLKASDLKTPL